MTRKNITYNQPLEKEIGFSRAVRIGNIIAVTATAPIAKDGSVHTPGDMYGQTKRCLEIIKDVIEQAGGKLDDVIRTRLFLKDMKRWKEAAKAHGEFFSNVQPACGFIGASSFINPEWLIEVEADCVLQK
ncbi:MAG: RidA family protein [Candidatus Aenigmarchaeota archaeon]|nr:RidA family protein [Candidatus Aenigmarchaeota archaeon]